MSKAFAGRVMPSSCLRTSSLTAAGATLSTSWLSMTAISNWILSLVTVQYSTSPSFAFGNCAPALVSTRAIAARSAFGSASCRRATGRMPTPKTAMCVDP